MSLVGVFTSVNLDRLERCLTSLPNNLPFPIVCWVQGASDDEASDLQQRFKKSGLKWVFSKKFLEPNLLKIRTRQLEITEKSDFIFLFDDDFIFFEDTLDTVNRAYVLMQAAPNVGAISFFRKNGNDPSILQYLRDMNNDYGQYMKFEWVFPLSVLWTNGGILLKRSAFKGYADMEKYVTGEDIGIFLRIILRGYDVLMTNLNVEHLAGEHADTATALQGQYYFGMSRSSGLGNIFKKLDRKNYLDRYYKRRIIKISRIILLKKSTRVTALTRFGGIIHMVNKKFRHKGRHTPAF